ncbi:MAG: hypothetical protein JOZ86_03465, partial [Candidatus Eremiobacteraeota bacterium]|nr:hypothetical protein [Candidatus Eremiobacteraeota bacterium]
YGIPANVQWKANLGERWDQYAHVLPLLAKSAVQQIRSNSPARTFRPTCSDSPATRSSRSA